MVNTENRTTAAVVPISVSVPSSIHIAPSLADILTSCQVDDGGTDRTRGRAAHYHPHLTPPLLSVLSFYCSFTTCTVVVCCDLHESGRVRVGVVSYTVFSRFLENKHFLPNLRMFQTFVHIFWTSGDYLLFSSSSRRPRFFGRSP